jgi:hypothetical protein
MEKNKLLRDLYYDHVEDYNRIKKINPLKGNSIGDVSFFYIDFEQVKNFVIKNRYKPYEEPDYSLFPTMNIVILTKFKDTIKIRFTLFINNEGKIDLYTSGTEHFENDDIEAEKVLTEAHGNETYLTDEYCLYFIEMITNKNTIMGTQEVKSRTRAGQEKVIPLVYITNKKYLNKSKETHSQVIDWRHSWEVIGHWRKISSIGKNREGEYCEIGRTWVNPSVRGEGELIQKIRVIKGEKK